MKRKTILLTVICSVITLAVGFLIGISVDYPKINKEDIAGTIGKIQKYRNSQTGLSDVEFQNELKDSVKKAVLANYLKYHYVMAVNMSNEIQYALEAAKAVETFKTAYPEVISNMERYNKYLTIARMDLLTAISAVSNSAKTEPALLRDFLNQANNVIAQISYRNSSVIDFIDATNTFIKSGKNENMENLKIAYDKLILNECNMALVKKDKMLMKLLEDKVLLADKEKLNYYILDSEKMKSSINADMEKLSIVLDSQKLNQYVYVTDADKLNAYGVIVIVGDVQKLNSNIRDAETLGGLFIPIIPDSEQLKFHGGHFADMERLNLVNDAEILK